MVNMDNETRAAIPTDLRRRVFIEAGHRCAIPTCRHIDVDVHHIVPWEKCRKHEYENLIALCPNCHRRANNGDIDRKALRIYKANLRYTHDKFSQLEVDMLFECYRLTDGEGIMWPQYLMLLVKRLLDSGYISRIESKSNSLFISGMKANPDFLIITETGRQYVNDLGIEHPEE